MYDAIILMCPCLMSESEKEAFFVSMCMSNIDILTGDRNNSGYQKLSQCRGVYVSYQAGRQTFKIQFSLHKYYNFLHSNEFQNYSDFSPVQAIESYKNLIEWLPFLVDSTVVYYEYGLNIQLSANVSNYLCELDCIMYGNRKMRVLESFRHKEYKLYSTNSDTTKRAAYIFYDKTEESKPHCPEMTLRVEKKCLRQNREIRFNELFELQQIEHVKRELQKNFVENLQYKSYQVHKGSAKDRELREMKMKYGEKTLEKIEEMRQSGAINRLQLCRMKKRFYEIEKEEIETKISPKSVEMREKIDKKLKKL